MRRWRAILLCLLGGALVNVGVALTLSLWLDLMWLSFTAEQVYEEEAAARGWPCPVPAGWPSPNVVTSHRLLGADSQTAITCDTPRGDSISPTHMADAFRVGWPLRTASCYSRSGPGGDADPQPPGPDFVSWRQGVYVIRAGPGYMCYNTVPVMPVWSGVAVNSLFYGAALWLAVAGAAAQRRVRRRRRGLCPRCAYDLRGVTCGCPECGAQP